MNKIDIIPEVVRVLRMEGQAILDCSQRLSQNSAAKQLQEAIHLCQRSLEGGGKIIVTGVGKSGKVAQKIAATLCSTGSFAVFIHPTEGLHGDLGLVRSEDVVLALSYTGNTEELLRLLPSFKSRGVALVGLGGNSQSKLAAQCDAWIDARVDQEACPHNLAPTSSTTLALALGDALALSLMQLRGFDSTSFAENHPGGSLGRKLHFKVEDVMQQGAAVAVVGPESTMEEVIVISTQKKLGAVLVVDGARLIGVITDGDLRRALQFREKFFHFKAAEVMTKDPVTTHPKMMAQAALKLMEDRPSQIAILPVVDEAGEWKGLLRLHDLVKAF